MSFAVILAAATALQVPSHLVAYEPGLTFPPIGQTAQLNYENVRPGIPFTEIIPSWNVEQAENGTLTIEIAPRGGGNQKTWYCIGQWCLDSSKSPRISVDNQKDEVARVLTDTLRLSKPFEAVDVRLTLRTLSAGPLPKLKLFSLNFSQPAAYQPSTASPSSAWGKVIDVPQRAQGNYPRGGVLCSPTSLSMVMWHFSNVLDRPELNKDVPEVELGVWDSVYDGAGNWPFNAAYAGSFRGMRSYVTRLSGIQDLEKWIDAGYPVICSAPLDMLQGLEKTRESGHVVVLVGFTKEGDPVFNDPAKRDEVRRTYKRDHFERAWRHSGRTVYIVHPEGAKVPSESRGLWIE